MKRALKVAWRLSVAAGYGLMAADAAKALWPISHLESVLVGAILGISGLRYVILAFPRLDVDIVKHNFELNLHW